MISSIVNPLFGLRLLVDGVSMVILCDDRSRTGADVGVFIDGIFTLGIDFNAASVADVEWLCMCVLSAVRCVNVRSHTGHLMPLSSECVAR